MCHWLEEMGIYLAVNLKDQGLNYFVEFLPVRLKDLLIDIRTAIPTDSIERMHSSKQDYKMNG